MYLSFVREAVMNPDYKGYIGGRVEVWTEESHYAEEEIRFFTSNKNEFFDFREKWDMEEVDEETYQDIKKKIKGEFHEDV